MYRYIGDWKWLDKHLGQLLFSRVTPALCQNAVPAIEYCTKEMVAFQRYLSRTNQFHSCENIHCCLVPHLDLLRKGSDCSHLLRYRELYYSVVEDYSLRGTPFCIDFIETQDIYHTTVVTGINGQMRYTRIPTSSLECSLTKYRCFIYVLETTLSFKDDLFDLLGVIKRHQTLIKVV